MSLQLSATALAGATVVITRPSGTAAPLIARAHACGSGAIALPGTSLHEIGDGAAVRLTLHAAQRADAWIFTSPAAVRFAFRLAPGLSMRQDAGVSGVGPGTLRSLTRQGIRASAPTGRNDSEGLLALPALADVRGWRIALVGAPGGRDLIAPTLRRRGAEVTAIHVYKRLPPRLTRRHFDALARAPDPLITLISSGAALTHLVALLPQPLLARLQHQILIVSSARLEALADEHGFGDVCKAASAAPDDLLEAAHKALTRHRL